MRHSRKRQIDSLPRAVFPESLRSLVDGTVAIVVYARVSSTRQKHEGTIASQLMVLREWVAAHPQFTAIEWFIEDGTTAEDLMRPVFQDMMRWLRQHRGHIKHVLCLDTSRFSRNATWGSIAIMELERQEVSVLYVDHDADESTPAGKMVEGMHRLVAEYMKASLLMGMERGKEGKLHAERGEDGRLYGQHGWVTTPPFGYTYVRIDGEKHGAITVVEEEAGFVRTIFARAVRGESTESLARWLNTTGVPTRRGALWSGSGVAYMLHNQIYKGEHIHRKFQSCLPQEGRTVRHGAAKSSARRTDDPNRQVIIKVPAVVSAAVWDAAQTSLHSHRVRWVPNPAYQERFLLRGLVHCMRDGRDVPGFPCDHAMAPMVGGKGYPYYRCGHAWNDPVTFKGHRCGSALNATRLDVAVWTYVRTLLDDPQRLADKIAESTRRAREELSVLEGQLAHLVTTAQRTQTALEALLAARYDPTPDLRPDERTFVALKLRYEKERDDADAARLPLVTRIDFLTASRGPNLANIERKVQALRANIAASDEWPFARKYEIVHELLERVEVVSRTEVRILCGVSVPDTGGGESLQLRQNDQGHLANSANFLTWETSLSLIP